MAEAKRNWFKSQALLALAVAACGLSACKYVPDISAEQDGQIGANPNDWPSWGRNPGESHFSPLEQIDSGNADELGLAWSYEVESGYSASTPIAADGKLFITTGHSHIRAFDVISGKVIWEYDGKTRERASNRMHMSWGNKGLAYHDGRVFIATTDGYVVSLDADSGKELWKTRDYGPEQERNMNGAPRVFDGKVIIGHGGADVGPIRGWVSAYDEKTGALAWRFFTVPDDPAIPAETKAEKIMRESWKGEYFKDGKRLGGGGTMWNAFTYDPELNLIYLGVGNGFPYSLKIRSPDGGDNLFLASIVAVNADTGEYVWHRQLNPAEESDYTATNDMTLATLDIDGTPRKVLMTAPKSGFFYVIDRTSGEFISAEKIAKVTWAKSIDPKTGRPIENPEYRSTKLGELFEIWPGPSGAHNWMPQSYNPLTGLVYIPVIEKGAMIGPQPGGQSELGLSIGKMLLPEADLKDPLNNTSYLKAWDPVSQTEKWRVKLPGAWPAGTMTSAGGLVFQGTMDGRFVAYDADNGEELWSYKTIAPIVGAPISYSVDGVQYVTVITGSGGTGAGINSLSSQPFHTDYRLPRQVLTFKLGGKAKIEPYEYTDPIPLVDPDFSSNPALAQVGLMNYGMTGCIACHGWAAIGGGAAPDLRYSPTILDGDLFYNIVVKGALRPNGMPDFKALTRTDSDAIRFYLRQRAQQAPAERAALIAGKGGSSAKPGEYAGKWKISVSTPMGDQDAVMDLKVKGNKVTGKVLSSQGNMAVAGSVSDGRMKISGRATDPMPMDVDYNMVLKNGKLTGESTTGPFGSFNLTGKR